MLASLAGGNDVCLVGMPCVEMPACADTDHKRPLRTKGGCTVDLHEIVRSLNTPLTPTHIAELEAVLPALQAQRAITQERLSQVQQRPSTRRGHSRANDRFETQREAMQEISAYLATLEMTIARIQHVVQRAQQEAISQQFTHNVRSGKLC
jgi:hypothetical protein